jgi:hypothetical protein
MDQCFLCNSINILLAQTVTGNESGQTGSPQLKDQGYDNVLPSWAIPHLKGWLQMGMDQWWNETYSNATLSTTNFI